MVFNYEEISKIDILNEILLEKNAFEENKTPNKFETDSNSSFNEISGNRKKSNDEEDIHLS